MGSTSLDRLPYLTRMVFESTPIRPARAPGGRFKHLNDAIREVHRWRDDWVAVVGQFNGAYSWEVVDRRSMQVVFRTTHMETGAPRNEQRAIHGRKQVN